MVRIFFISWVFLFIGNGLVRGEDQVATLLKDIQAVAKQGAGSPAARSAWDKLVARGPAALVPVLEAMDTPNTVAANWLRTAFDRIVEREIQAGGKRLDLEPLLAFAKNPKRQGRARRLALETVEQLRPGTSVQLIQGWLEDPEFRFDAVAAALKEAGTMASAADKEKAYQKALAAARDPQQVQDSIVALEKLGVKISVVRQLGFLTDWYLLGPFDARAMKGFKAVYPPEQKIDLDGEYPGKENKIRWKRQPFKEPPATAGWRGAMTNLAEALGAADDAVAYAYTEFEVAQDQEVEFRGAGDDNFSVWVNGKKEFGFEEYRNGVRLDRHRFRVKLTKGKNTVLVKIIQAPTEATNPQGNWEFFLRMVDETGKGIERKDAFPATK